ncbi:MAG: acetyl-CoA carboxylase biotin carboxyl carrier protein [Sphingomicrobium sp.]
MRIDARLVQQLADLLTKNGLTEIEVEDGDRKIRVGRAAAPVIAAQAAFAPAAAPAAAGDVPAAVAPAEAVPGETIKSPMVGTAFLSPEPGAAPFITVGAAVKAGDTLLIIEAMKVMNPITAPHAGVVKSILISDAYPVEFDQPLLVLG